MAHTNSTTNYGLPQWIGSDKPTFLGDFNSAFNTIDTQMKSNADTAAGAAETASSANATAISANETAVAADGKATLAKNTADAATSTAQSASDLATVAKNTADNAAHAALGNNISNLAPAYDETRTYSVGDLVTYVDENNTGKLYKCIVAWNTPGAFNINYWDDVTASDVMYNPVKIVASITADGSTSYHDILSALADTDFFSNATFDDLIKTALIRETPQGEKLIHRPGTIRDGGVNYYRTISGGTQQSDTFLYTSMMGVYKTESASNKNQLREVTCDIDTSTWTVSYKESADYPAAGTKFYICQE